MFRITLNRIAFASAILLLLLGIACNASAGESEQQVCDVGADYALASKITRRRSVFTPKSCASVRTTHSLIIIWVLPKE